MNEEEIIKGLRFCAGTDCHCEECPYEDTDKGICIDNLMYEAADALESQQTRIADLENQLSESQRREKAAVCDVRKCCETCEHNYGTMADYQKYCHGNDDPLTGKNCKNWQYRGPQVGEGEAK